MRGRYSWLIIPGRFGAAHVFILGARFASLMLEKLYKVDEKGASFARL